MKPPPLRFLALAAAANFALCTLVVAPGLTASEIAAIHVVFEKAAKMKKADTFLYLPLVDQSRPSDTPSAPRLISCRAFAEGAGGPLQVTGTFRLELIGEIQASAEQWESGRVASPIDADGRATFQPASILDLVDRAQADNATAGILRIEFDGGKGPKVRRLTVDCENRRAES